MRKVTEKRLARLFDELLHDTDKVFVVERETDEGTVIDISLPIILESVLTIPVRMVEDEPDDETLFLLRYNIMNEAYNTITKYMTEKILKLDEKRSYD